MALVQQFAASENGSTVIEYALIASFIAVAIVGALTTLFGKLGATYASIEAATP